MKTSAEIPAIAARCWAGRPALVDVTTTITFPDLYASARRVAGEVAAAAVTLVPGARFDAAQARASCADVLADFKVPGRIVAVQELPTTPSGNVQKSRLQQLLTRVPAQKELI